MKEEPIHSFYNKEWDYKEYYENKRFARLYDDLLNGKIDLTVEMLTKQKTQKRKQCLIEAALLRKGESG